MSAIYEHCRDIGLRRKSSYSNKFWKRYGRHIFRKRGKELLDNAPTKYWGCLGWYN